jgi:hypothetical protein
MVNRTPILLADDMTEAELADTAEHARELADLAVIEAHDVSAPATDAVRAAAWRQTCRDGWSLLRYLDGRWQV